MLPMFSFLMQYMEDTFNEKMHDARGWQARIRMTGDDGNVATYFETFVFKKRVILDCDFSQHFVQRFVIADCILKSESTGTKMRLAGYEDIPVQIIPDRPGSLRFDVTDFDESKTRALADFMLQWYPLEMVRDRDAKRKLVMGMALHSRLGKESALGRIGSDMLLLVAKHI
jgi:hypothetical protein